MNNLHAMPVLLVVLSVMAIAYRYYSAFIAAKVATLNDLAVTPAVRLNDGQNYDPTNKWVLFGHHFAAISGAGPLIGPVLAAQFGFMPGLTWIVVGVCIGGAVQDFLVLVASMRRDGKSLAQIAFGEIGRVAGLATMAAVLFIIVIALAGLGKVVVKALGGDEVPNPPGSKLVLCEEQGLPERQDDGTWLIRTPPQDKKLEFTRLTWAKSGGGSRNDVLHEEFRVKLSASQKDLPGHWEQETIAGGPPRRVYVVALPAGSLRQLGGSSWGTFTIACTIPIALFVGLYMYRIRKGKVVEASLIGATLTLAAVVIGGWVSRLAFGRLFNLTETQVVWSMAAYGFVAAVLPVWVLLCPRDYLSSFLKIGTIVLLVAGTLVANPKFQAPAFNSVFASGGPVVSGSIFPFLFICVMCGAISGFHTLVSSGTTPKMIMKESHARPIGYGAMLIEGLVGVVAMIAAATLPPGDYYAMNTRPAMVDKYDAQFAQLGASVDHLNVYDARTEESLRGRTAGAVTLAVGMAEIFDQALRRVGVVADWLWKYWYHFAIMFEALFILTTIDAGTRIGRFLLQEVAGKVHPKLGQTSWWPGAIGSTALIVLAWSYFIRANSMEVIWPMFGIGNQMLAVIALTIVSVVIVNEGKQRYLWVTLIPMSFVVTTTSTAALQKLAGIVTGLQTLMAPGGAGLFSDAGINALVLGLLILAMLVCAYTVMIAAAIRIWPALTRRPLVSQTV